MSNFTEAYMTSQGWIVEFRGGYWYTMQPCGLTFGWVLTCCIDWTSNKRGDCVLVEYDFPDGDLFYNAQVEALTEAYQNIHSSDGLISGRKISGLPGSDS